MSSWVSSAMTRSWTAGARATRGAQVRRALGGRRGPRGAARGAGRGGQGQDDRRERWWASRHRGFLAKQGGKAYAPGPPRHQGRRWTSRLAYVAPKQTARTEALGAGGDCFTSGTALEDG